MLLTSRHALCNHGRMEMETARKTPVCSAPSLHTVLGHFAYSSPFAAVRTASSSFDLANSLVARATGTAMNYTPKSVVSLVQAAVETYTVVRTDGLVGLKPYVPTFVVQTGEQTYEIVANVRQSVHDQYSATSGFIVTRVNGVVERVTAVPIVSKLLDRITGLVGHANASAAATTAATSEDNHVTPILMSQVGEDEFHDAPTAVGRDKDNHVSSDLEEVSTMKGEFSVLENGVDVVTV
ncbi:hypothetical protein BC830DRAFT_650677 [Chytriomyces sp. MP71]|nr:hypothetical protein BC830DRAFT_650677 [Chytriomyces sp. MP71]